MTPCFDQPLRTCILTLALAVTLLTLTVTVISTSPSNEESVWQQYRDQIAPPVPAPVQICWHEHMCNRIVTGTAGGTWVIEAPSEYLKNIQDYQTATFDQRIVERAEGRVTVQIRSKAVLETKTSYPLAADDVPSHVHSHLEPTYCIQSDAPPIVQLAQQLVEEAETEAQAVVAILDWVRGNISYDYTLSLPRDALSVYQNRSGTCSGFSSLSTALLRAAGIPARVISGCAMWSLPAGGGHAWIEVYYPDLGWVPSEPQSQQNFADRHLVAPNWPEFCGRTGTSITYTERLDIEPMHLSRTPYDSTIRNLVSSANVPAWDRNPARSSVSQISSMVTLTQTESTHHLTVGSAHCHSTDWIIESSADWLTVWPARGSEHDQVTVSIDTSQFSLGKHSAVLTIWTPYAERYYDTSSREVPVNIWIAETVHETHLPLVAKDGVVDQGF